jgi:threonine dehydrogenase-like Zn-dependent dehydrogenase
MIDAIYGEHAIAQTTPPDIMRRKLTIDSTFVQIGCFPRALNYLESKKAKVDEIDTHDFFKRDYQNTLNLTFAREVIKIAIIT